MTVALDRRLLVASGLATGWAAAAGAAPKPVPRDDIALGSARAPVTVIEYASLGCPHCAAWATDVWPAFKAKYVDTGKVRFVLREMLTGNPSLAGAGFLTARCAGPARYYQVVEAVFAEFPAMADGSETPFDGLLKAAKGAGLTEAQVNACLRDNRAIAALQAREKRAEADGVTGTPTFVVAGVTLDGDHTLEVLSEAVDKALKRRGRR